MLHHQFLRSALGATLAAAICIIATPASANSAASADIAAPLRAAEAARNGVSAPEHDNEFSMLFASWKSLDGGVLGANAWGSSAAGNGEVSIPMLVPVTSNRGTSSNFGMRIHPVLGGYRAHKGVDLPATTGTPIHATADGTVARADWFGGYGLYVQLEHGANLQTRYGHMSRIAVAEGQRVHKGDVIGYVGSTGRSTGAHLHYEVRIAGEAVNPVPYMQVAQDMAQTSSLAAVSTDGVSNTRLASLDGVR
ncbi:M23 family metallopeptidase [Novosphingobium sp. FKTRR1]|uniref:M23 family metallopeptidase n=1 Tax=Novosphingobium sp. FKTRR1 TaxID=2879118 RepID=UPI001CF03E84|nr:M23 family metallopeptidase [Novosphingobium sp. FKTRR1]